MNKSNEEWEKEYWEEVEAQRKWDQKHLKRMNKIDFWIILAFLMLLAFGITMGILGK